ncbi:site-specific integrase [Paenibacillus sp. EKM208P]|nr:site-specific integrase [Paenibacillus sp. EKM208P]
MLASNNVVGLHQNNVNGDIKVFIGKFQSKYTQRNYERSIRSFFMWFKNKEIEELTEEDILIKNKDIVGFQTYLRNHEADYSNIYINNIIAAVQSLYSFFEINEYPVNSMYTKVDVLSDDSERSGALYLDEAETMAQLVYEDRKQSQEKSAFIRMAYTTSFRKSSLLSLKWSDIRKNPIANHYLVKTVGKGGKKHEVPISCELYNELLKIKDQPYYSKYKDEKIFHLSNNTIQNMMNGLKEKMGIPPERNIKFHSFRNVASGYGTLEETKQHLNHKNITTTENYYRHSMTDFSNSLSLRIEDKIDDSIFDSLSKEELIQIILNQGQGNVFQMKKEAREIVNSKKGR